MRVGVALMALALLSACGSGGDSGEDLSALSTQQPGVTTASNNPANVPAASDGAASVNSAPTAPANSAPTAPANPSPTLPPFPGEITDVILVTGQSNALGADTAFDAALDSPVDRAFAFTSEGWVKADLHQVWDLNWHPRGDPATDPSNNFGFHFARKVAERRSHRMVGFILVTAPGAPIETWDYESDFYLSIRNRVVDALNQLPSKATIDGILWHQGETDWEDTPYYEGKLADVINNFRTESWYSSDKPFICGETAFAPLNRILTNLNTDGDPWTGCVESDGLQTQEDQVHFTAEGLRILGTRYATKYLQLIEQ